MDSTGTKNNLHLKFGKRHILVICLFTGFVCNYVMRVSINTAIVFMAYENDTTNSSIIVDTNSTSSDICPIPKPETNNNTNQTSLKRGELYWDHYQRGLVKSSFYYGYICTQFIGGYLPQIIGGRFLLGAGVAGTAVLTLLNPIAARTDVSFLIAIRVLEGLSQGLTFPCGYFLMSNWFAKQERSILITLSMMGTNVGTVVAAPLTALLCEYGFDGGWASSFYIFGGVTLLWCVAWFYLVSDSPSQHPTISKEERDYIEANCQSRAKPVPFRQIPWKAMALSPPVWALTIGSTCYGWNYYTVLTEISTYLNDVLHISSSMNGLIASLPYAGLVCVQLTAALVSDIIRSKGVPTTLVRKGTFLIGMLSSGTILICVRYAGCDTTVVVAMLCLAVGINGIAYVGYVPNHMDICPKYSSITMGFVNTIGQLPGIISPIISGSIVNENPTSISTWQTIFYIAAGITMFGAIVFAIWGSGELQEWARVTDDDKESPTKEVENATSTTTSSVQPSVGKDEDF